MNVTKPFWTQDYPGANYWGVLFDAYYLRVVVVDPMSATPWHWSVNGRDNDCLYVGYNTNCTDAMLDAESQLKAHLQRMVEQL